MSFYYDPFYNMPPAKTETIINGIRQTYDACSDWPLEEAKQGYEKAFEYIGSSFDMYINDIKQTLSHEYHFFNRKSKPATPNDPLNP